MSVKAIILDIDGVIVGERIGYNSPDPHPAVIQKLKDIRAQSIPISLCTAKPHFAIGSIIRKAGLDNYHITNGGGVIINTIENKIVKKHIINNKLAQKVIETYLENGVYIEFYTVDGYFIQKNQTSNITVKHRHILQREAQKPISLVKEAEKSEITKIMPIAKNEEDKKRLTDLFNPFKDNLTLSWGVHPVALPLQFGIITALGISKKEGAIEISRARRVPLKNMLGVGDSLSDWQFIGLCGYKAAMGNAGKDLKQLVLSAGKDRSFIGPSVDENGIIKILDQFIKLSLKG